MSALGRRELLRMAAPAIALPMVATATVAEAKEQRLVTRDEIMQAFRFYDHMELRADDLNLRYQILIDMLFETNPENLRAKLQQLVDGRKDHVVLVDRESGHFAPYDPSMYDEQGRFKAMVETATADQAAWEQDMRARVTSKLLPKPKLRTRIAGWLLGWRFS